MASTAVTSGAYVLHSFTITATDNYNQLILGPFNLATPTSPTLTAKFFNVDDLSIVAADPCPLTGSGSIWIWDGSNGTDWFDKCNWNRNAVPDCSADVIIPNTGNQPVITGTQAFCNTLEVQSSLGANLEIDVSGGGSLKVKSVTGICP